MLMNPFYSQMFLKRHQDFFSQESNSRVGELKCSAHIMIDREFTRRLFGRIIPLNISYDDMTDTFLLTGISKQFDILERGQPIPRYLGEIKKVTKKGKPAAYFMTFKKEQ